MIIIKIG